MKPFHFSMRAAALPALLLIGAVSSLPAADAGYPPHHPQTLARRRAEIEQLTAEMNELSPRMEALEAKLMQMAPAYLKVHDAVQAVPLSREERVALKQGGIDALSPEKAAPFRAAEGPLRALDGVLKEYFAAYDHYKWNEAQVVVFGALIQSIEKRYLHLAGRLSKKKEAKAEELVAKALAKEKALREALADPEVATYMKASSIDGLWKAVHFADVYLDKMMRKEGLAPRRTFGAMLRGLGQRIHHWGRLTWVHARTVPAIAKMVGYLLNPLRKKGDPEKFSQLLRGYAKSYEKATGLKIDATGAEGVPTDGPIVYAAAHRGGLGDMIAMLTQAPTDFSFLAHWGVFPKVVARRLKKEPTLVLVGVPEEENGGKKVGATQAAIDSLRSGRDILVFAEGSTPSKNGETNSLRTGIDYMTDAISEDPVYIVPVGIKGPADGFDSWKKVRPSLEGQIEIDVRFGRAIDPLKLKSIPGSGQGFMLDLIRVFFNKSLYHPDEPLRPEEG